MDRGPAARVHPAGLSPLPADALNRRAHPGDPKRSAIFPSPLTCPVRLLRLGALGSRTKMGLAAEIGGVSDGSVRASFCRSLSIVAVVAGLVVLSAGVRASGAVVGAARRATERPSRPRAGGARPLARQPNPMPGPLDVPMSPTGST